MYADGHYDAPYINSIVPTEHPYSFSNLSKTLTHAQIKVVGVTCSAFGDEVYKKTGDVDIEAWQCLTRKYIKDLEVLEQKDPKIVLLRIG